jgi:hypothetical protein
MGFNPVKDHAADRETCRGAFMPQALAFGAKFTQITDKWQSNASPLPIVPPIAKILHTQNRAIRQC